MSSLERYFQPNRAFTLILVLAAFQYTILALFILGASPDFVVGGDFVAFWSAARETLNGDLAALYASDGLAAAIEGNKGMPDRSRQRSTARDRLTRDRFLTREWLSSNMSS